MLQSKHRVQAHVVCLVGSGSAMYLLVMLLLVSLFATAAACAFSMNDDLLPQAATPRLEKFARTVMGQETGISLAPGQECDAPFPGLTAKPFHDSKDFEFSAVLEKEWKTVANELEQYLNNKEREVDEAWSDSVTKLCDDTSGFSKLAILDEHGEVCTRHFPKTIQLLQRIQNLAPRPVCINRQAPGTGLAPHSDNMNFLLTSHLGLFIPKQCLFRNGGVTRQWEPGKVLVTDTSFVHSTVNNSNQDRYVLSFCIWHPDLTRDEQVGIVRIHDALRRETTEDT